MINNLKLQVPLPGVVGAKLDVIQDDVKHRS